MFRDYTRELTLIADNAEDILGRGSKFRFMASPEMNHEEHAEDKRLAGDGTG